MNGGFLKNAILALFLLVTLQAKSYQCPSSIYSKSSEYKFIEKLKKFEGQFSLGSCQVELSICDFNDNKGPTYSEFAGDILITDSEGFERYVPLFFVENKSRKTKHVTAIDSKTLLYRFKDKNFDPKTGRFEKWAIEIKQNDDTTLNYLEIAFKNQHNRFNSSEKHWVVCGKEREEQYERSPLFHTMRSWCTWVTKAN